jgi:hypothetical protein
MTCEAHPLRGNLADVRRRQGNIGKVFESVIVLASDDDATL